MFDIVATFSPPQEAIEAQCVALANEIKPVLPSDAKPVPDQGSEAAIAEAIAKRREAMRTAAIAAAAQHAYERFREHVQTVMRDAEIQSIMDEVFDFQLLVTSDGVLYPVIREARDGKEINEDGTAMRTSQITWEIVKPARIVPASPNWRQYFWLMKNGSAPKAVSAGVAPVDSEDERIWKQAVCDGYRIGIKQALASFADSLAALRDDYIGMLRFRYLVDQNIVSEPKVAKGDRGIIIEKGGARASVGERYIRIDAPAVFRMPGDWQVRELDNELSNEEVERIWNAR